MVVNNWFVIVDVIVNATGSEYYKIFFIFFYVLSVILIINIIVAFVIDIYSSVEDLNAESDNMKSDIQRERELFADQSKEQSEESSRLNQQNLVRLENNHEIQISKLAKSTITEKQENDNENTPRYEESKGKVI